MEPGHRGSQRRDASPQTRNCDSVTNAMGEVSRGKETLPGVSDGILRKDFLREVYLSYTLKGELALDRRPPSRKPSAQRT